MGLNKNSALTMKSIKLICEVLPRRYLMITENMLNDNF